MKQHHRLIPHGLLEPLESRQMLSAGLGAHIPLKAVVHPVGGIRAVAATTAGLQQTQIAFGTDGLELTRQTPPLTLGATIHAQAGENFSGYLGTLAIFSRLFPGLGPATSPIIPPAPANVATVNRVDVPIGWGDGAMSAATLVPNPRGGYDVYGQHTYAVAGTYGITVEAEGRLERNPAYHGPPFMIFDHLVLTTTMTGNAVVT